MERAHGAGASLAWWRRAGRREKEGKDGRRGGEGDDAREGEGRGRGGGTGGEKYSDWASQGEGARGHDELGLEKKRDAPRNNAIFPRVNGCLPALSPRPIWMTSIPGNRLYFQPLPRPSRARPPAASSPARDTRCRPGEGAVSTEPTQFASGSMQGDGTVSRSRS